MFPMKFNLEWGDCIFSDDFSNPSTWTTGYDPSACSRVGNWNRIINWRILSNSTIESTTADNGYAMVDSDEYGGEEGGTETEDSWFTTASPINLSDYP